MIPYGITFYHAYDQISNLGVYVSSKVRAQIFLSEVLMSTLAIPMVSLLYIMISSDQLICHIMGMMPCRASADQLWNTGTRFTCTSMLRQVHTRDTFSSRFYSLYEDY